MEENTGTQEILRVTINGNCSIFIPDNFEKFLATLKEYMNGAKFPYTTISLEGYADYHLTEKCEVTCRVTDCMKVAQFK